MRKVTNSISEYIAKNKERKLIHWKVKGSKIYFKHNDMLVEEKYFCSYYPEYHYIKSNGKGNRIGNNHLL